MDVKTGITLPTIGDVEDAIQGKQATISDNGLSTSKISGLDTTYINNFINGYITE